MHRAPGGKKTRLLEGARPILHSWNNFEPKAKRKPPLARRTSPSKNIDKENMDNNLAVRTEHVHVDLGDTRNEKNDETQLISDYEKEINSLKLLNEQLMLKNQELSKQLNLEEIPVISYVKLNDKNCNHYTGFKSVKRLMAVFEFLDFGVNSERLILYNNQSNQETGRGRPRALSPFNSYVLTSMRLRRNFSLEHLSYLFKVSSSTISNTTVSYINYMYLKFGALNIWPTKEQIKNVMPKSCKEKFPNTRTIIDCVEFKVEVPSKLFLHKLFYSDYKSHTTVKVLVGITPGGGFNFISSAYPGSISDKDITFRSGISNPHLWEQGDAIMADRGFTIQEYTDNLGIELIIPSFLNGRDQLSEKEVIHTQQIASERIELGMIQRLKCYHIFDRPIQLSMVGTLNQIILVCVMLANFDDPIIQNSKEGDPL